MLLLLALAGISLSASAVTWWNGRRADKVREEIDRLVDARDAMFAADAAQRRSMLSVYLAQFIGVVDDELRTRDQIATELIRCVTQARQIQKQRFGSRESATFQRVFLELDMALARAQAERAYLGLLLVALKDALQDGSDDTLGPTALELPSDFPRLGGIVQFDADKPPRELHDYRLTVIDWSRELDGRAAIVAVDHDRRTATLSTIRGALLESNLDDGGTPLRAKVARQDGEGVLLDFSQVSLLLPRVKLHTSSLSLEQEVEVYPDVWTLSEVLNAGSGAPLPVRLYPRVEGSRTRWSPILLSVDEARLPQLVAACETFSEKDDDVPWRVHLNEAGGFGFTLGRVTLETRVDHAQQAFVLVRVTMDTPPPDSWVRMQVELSVLVPGTEDDLNADRSLFVPFIAALHGELDTQKLQMSQRRAALRLRKLSLIYQDQEDHLRFSGTVHFMVGRTENGGRTVIGTVFAERMPDWLDDALLKRGQRMRAIGPDRAWSISGGTWIDRRFGTCRLQLAVPDEVTRAEIAPFDISHLELAGEGSQQQIMSKALERAIVGRFASARVHECLLGLPGDSVDNANLGKDSVDRLLRSDSKVVAIWGPPGTGKTTTLVGWLRSLFPPGKENTWPSVLIAAPTHVAVSKLLGDLLESDGRLSEFAVRYGSRQRIAGTHLEPVWHERILASLDPANRASGNQTPSAARWARTYASPEGREAAIRWMMASRCIHAATCMGVMRRDFGLANRTFDIAIIDEAGKAFGAELLIPAALARRVVMVGDQNQLPPTVTSEALDEAIGYRLSRQEVEELLKRNMFQEWFEQLPAANKGMLTLQHRMHEHIGTLVSELFYEGRLQSRRAEPEWALTSRRLVFADFTAVGGYRSRRSSKSHSQENATERAALHALLERLDAANQGTVRNVLVICPYGAQREAVERERSAHGYTFSLSVTTVDAVQGGEADLVILLMTRHRGRVEFLLDRHRLNVALSRAREAVIVFGHLGCLAQGGHSPIAQMVDFGRRKDTLDLVTLPRQADFSRDLAARIVP